jgi:hypothetical protein
MGPARAGLVRNALGSLAILGVVVLIAIGLPHINRSLPAGRSVAAGAPYTVGAGVSVVPPVGAYLDVTKTRPSADRGTALFVVGGVRLVLVVTPFDGTLDRAADRLHRKITRISGYQVTGLEQAVWTRQGIAGVRGAYTSPGRLGEYAVFVTDGLAVEVTVSGPETQLRGFMPALEHSLGSMTFGGVR